MTSEHEKPYDSPGFHLWQVTNLWQKNYFASIHRVINAQSTLEDVANLMRTLGSTTNLEIRS